MNDLAKLASIRCGKFTVQVGVLNVDNAQTFFPEAGELPKPERRDMPIIAIGWLGSDYLPFFHSLN